MITIKGIYCITNLINDKKYIGQSIDINRRFNRHKFDLRARKHINQHLQSAWDKYGSENFSFDVICLIDDNAKLSDKEKEYISKYDTFVNGYNRTIGGESGFSTFLGKKHTLESKKKMRLARKRQIITDEHKKNISNGLRGKKRKPFTDEHKKKLSEAHKGKKLSKETIEKISLLHKGRKLSDGAKKKISDAHKGKSKSIETRKKISDSKTRYVFSEMELQGIKIRVKNGESIRSIAKDYGCSHMTLIRKLK